MATTWHGLRTAVHVDGSINDPSAENKCWSVEVVIPFAALYEYQKERRAPKNGEFYRMNFSRVQWKVDIKDNTYVKRTNEAGNVLPEDNWYGLRPVSSTFITRNSGLSFSSLTTATTHRVTSRFRRTNTANGNSASCITQKTFCLRQPVPTATVLPSYRRPLPLTLQMTSTKPSKLLTTPLRPQATLT